MLRGTPLDPSTALLRSPLRTDSADMKMSVGRCWERGFRAASGAVLLSYRVSDVREHGATSREAPLRTARASSAEGKPRRSAANRFVSRIRWDPLPSTSVAADAAPALGMTRCDSLDMLMWKFRVRRTPEASSICRRWPRRGHGVLGMTRPIFMRSWVGRHGSCCTGDDKA